MFVKRAALFLLLAAACGNGDRAEAGATGATRSASTASAAPTTTASVAAASPYAGRWEGKYDARRGDVSVPAGVAYGAWKEDGTRAAGPGTIEIEIAADGDVSGKIGGALGDLVIRGRMEDGALAAGVTPSDALADPAMRGVLHGTLRGDAIEAELRVSSQDGEVVRAASTKLTRRGSR
jgi:hypothetical protein